MSTKKPTNPKMEESELSAARQLSESVGGLEMTLGVPALGKMAHFTDKLPQLEITVANAKRKISVEVSSVQQDNDVLLQYLYRKTVES